MKKQVAKLPCQKNLRVWPCLHVFACRVISPKNLRELYSEILRRSSVEESLPESRPDMGISEVNSLKLSSFEHLPDCDIGFIGMWSHMVE